MSGHSARNSGVMLHRNITQNIYSIPGEGIQPQNRSSAMQNTHGLNSSTPFHDFAHHTTVLRSFRLGARRVVMLEHHKRRATTPGAAGASPAYP